MKMATENSLPPPRVLIKRDGVSRGKPFGKFAFSPALIGRWK